MPGTPQHNSNRRSTPTHDCAAAAQLTRLIVDLICRGPADPLSLTMNREAAGGGATCCPCSR
eukprot:scaffold32108_cov17-Tisochrysis_lutea.AAC.1